TLYYMQLSTAMLADGAQMTGGKLYILGGQWDRITVAKFPAQHPTMAVVLVIRVDYNEAPKTCNVGIDLMLDGEAVGVKGALQMSIGHAAVLKRGAPQFAPVAVTFPNVLFDRPGRYEWVITADTTILGQIPLEVVQGVVIGPSPDQPGGASEVVP